LVGRFNFQHLNQHSGPDACTLSLTVARALDVTPRNLVLATEAVRELEPRTERIATFWTTVEASRDEYDEYADY